MGNDNIGDGGGLFVELRAGVTTGKGVGFILGINALPRLAGKPPLFIIDVWLVNLSFGGTIPIIVDDMIVTNNTHTNIHRDWPDITPTLLFLRTEKKVQSKFKMVSSVLALDDSCCDDSLLNMVRNAGLYLSNLSFVAASLG
jgi:hypothetical protein